MSRKTTLLKRKLRPGGDIDNLIPKVVAKGKGTYLQNSDTGYEKAPHGLRGEGKVCSLPISSDKESRLRSMKR